MKIELISIDNIPIVTVEITGGHYVKIDYHNIGVLKVTEENMEKFCRSCLDALNPTPEQ